MYEEDGPHILVVKGHPPTARIIANVLCEIDPGISVGVVRDGSHCLAVLRGEHVSISIPDLVPLDLKLLEVDGLRVLEERRKEDTIQADPPFVVLSGEDDSETVIQCYDRGANTFFQKPKDLDVYLGVAGSIVGYWVTNAELPSDHAASA